VNKNCISSSLDQTLFDKYLSYDRETAQARSMIFRMSQFDAKF